MANVLCNKRLIMIMTSFFTIVNKCQYINECKYGLKMSWSLNEIDDKLVLVTAVVTWLLNPPTAYPPTHRPNNHRLTDDITFKRLEKYEDIHFAECKHSWKNGKLYFGLLSIWIGLNSLIEWTTFIFVWAFLQETDESLCLFSSF